MISYLQGNLLESGAEALVNTVNTVGVSGKGIALMFKDAFPENFRAYAAANGADQSTIVGIDALANFLTQVIGAPLAASILAASVAMLQSRLFPAWLCWLGLVAGAVASVYGVIAGAAFEAGGSCAAALCLTGSVLPGLAQLLSVTLLGAWIWMIATGVVLFRAADRPRTRNERALDA